MKTTDLLSLRKTHRREKILDAAQALFVKSGLRMTTMESVAESAAMSKATVYSYFKDKDQLFDGVARRVADQLRTAVQDALSEQDTLAAQISCALIRKHRIVFELVRQSAHASELFSAKNRLAGDLFKALDQQIEHELFGALKLAGYATRDAKLRARVLFAASQGIANHSLSFEAAAKDIEWTVNVLLADT